jgi:hypothetical protein
MHIDRRATRLLADHVSEGPDDELLSTQQVAEWLCCSIQFLEISRGRGTGPRFEHISPRKIMYRRKSVRDWLRHRERRSTAEYNKRAAKRR